MNINFIKRYLLLTGMVWSLVCAAALLSHLLADYQETVRRVQARAEAMLERDILYRNWVASHGGVYVPVTETALPNPHLEFLPERDVDTTDGRHLTLVNPSYMSRLVFEQGNRHGYSTSKITSLKYLNPDNAPDAWERNALLQCEQGAGMVSDVVEQEDQAFVRVMRPFYVESICLRCHANQGYTLGDVRGGLSVSIPFEPFFSGHWRHHLLSISLFGLLWGVGLGGVVLLGRKLYAQTCAAVENERLRDHAEMSLNFMSSYDRHTNLPNRFKFEQHLHEVFLLVEDTGGLVAVMTVAIRNLKQIIDNFDHPITDKLFKLMAERIAVLVTPEDLVARFGEDRLLFSYTCRSGKTFSDALMQKMFAEISKPVILEGYEFFPVICIGCAFYPSDAEDARSLVHNATTGLTFCLENNKPGIQPFSQSLLAEAKNRLNIESGLRRAFEEKNFSLFLQPQLDAKSGALVGAEALLRWHQDGRGFVSPAEFIPVAEDSGLILPMGEWVLQTACIQAIKLKELFGLIIPIGVNVSAKQFQDPEFIDIVDEVLALEGMLPEMLEIEITEGTFIEDIDRTIELLTDLKVRQLQIAIDDFGTGYSSLSYLRKFPVDRLKIDRSFVVDLAHNEEDRVLVELITEMGHKLGLNVIAEGVEDETQRQLLVGMGCDAIQGYLYSRPLPFDDFCRWIGNQCRSLQGNTSS